MDRVAGSDEPAPSSGSERLASNSRLRQPARIRAYFDSTVNVWEDLYDRQDVYALTYQERFKRVLTYAGNLGLPAESLLLDVGCGPGYVSVELARRQYQVWAIDIAMTMIERTRQRAAAAGVERHVRARTGNIQELEFPDGTFDLVLSVGVLPWVGSPQKALAEMSRVLKPGGFLIVTVANRWALHHLLDPILNPLTEPMKRILRRVLTGFGWHSHPVSRVDSPWVFDRWLRKAGFEKMASTMVGFGPFSLFRQELPRRIGIRLDRFLQELADAETPILRRAGHGYIVLCRKPSPDSPHN